ncbi:MAG TPA: beta-galactosidase GalA [Opitutaceae bacterium]|nr:beta-galactosidase GalA [Opitutaceae bacterium]
MDKGWSFHLGNDWGEGQSLAKAGTGMGPADGSQSVASWRRVDLPHDWAIELPFDPTADGSHGFRALGEGFPQNSVAWYRRSFDLPQTDSGRRLWLEFDGVYRDSTVFVNGWFAGHHESGYSGFRCDITDVANCGGRNVVAVRVDAARPEGWFYEGAGIYRHVWLVKTAPLAVAPDGVFVSSRFKDNVPAGDDEVHLEARILNSTDAPADLTVTWEISAPGGGAVATATRSGRAEARAALDLEQRAQVRSPQLWSPETPRLYSLATTVASGGRTIDRVETAFGIRTVGFDPDKGFMLNGRPYQLKGTSNHQDHAGVGAALPDGLQYFRIARLKEMGCNAYRTAHNPPTPELLEACDRLGMLVMDENRLIGSDAQHMDRFERQIRRDRNHPSVAIWSLGNEEFSAEGTAAGGRVARTMQDLVKRLDPARPVTFNADLGNEYAGINEVIEVRGWSYHVGPAMDAYHKAHPRQPNVGSEQGSTVGTRGIYANDAVRGYVSAYDDNAPNWAQTAETWVSYFATRPWLSGGFVWTGFDYRGEPTPYGWPCINSHFGIMDTCGFPKDNYWYYQSWWTDRPVLHLMPHWNWPGREGQEIDVRALSNCDEVELFLNGRSLGRQAMKAQSVLRWKVRYEAGALSARGLRGGRVVAETKVETTGAPAAVQLSPDRAAFDANGEDVAVVTVSIADAQGRVMPVAGNEVSFELEGPGRIIGVGNGDPSCHEPDTFVAAAPFRTVPIGGWLWKNVANPYAPNMPEEGAQFDDSSWGATDVKAENGPPELQGKAVFRTRFSVTAGDLEASVVELWFGRIAGGVSVYLNGQKIGGPVDSRAPSVYDVKALLHPGENTIAVATDNWGPPPAGPGRGVLLRLQDDPPAVHWRRSAFNGLAEVIVQSSREPGSLRLTARSEGLDPASLALQSRPAPPRLAVP